MHFVKHMCVNIQPPALIALAFALLLIPLPWIGAWILAALFHECCHMIMIAMCGGRIKKLELCAGGARIQTQGLTWGRELLAALAGPAGGLMLVLLQHRYPRLAVCALCQSLFNLLPLYPLDGGRALRCLLRGSLPPPIAAKTENIAAGVCFAVLAGCTVYLQIYWKMGILPMASLIYLGIHRKKLLQTELSGGTINQI